MNLQKRLYCSSQDHAIGGVCGGIATYLNVDSTIVRIVFALLALLNFELAAGLYIILWVIMPGERKQKAKAKSQKTKTKRLEEQDDFSGAVSEAQIARLSGS